MHLSPDWQPRARPSQTAPEVPGSATVGRGPGDGTSVAAHVAAGDDVIVAVSTAVGAAVGTAVGAS